MKNILEKTKEIYRKKVRMPTKEELKEAQMVEEIRKTRLELESAYNRFENESNEVMLDSVIYEIQSLRARYRFLLQIAREQGIECDIISVFN
ncbi:MAG: DUF2508 family protein [Clostridia bacterium]|nr:DUF2508 family protein [Clostridia bacterium]